MSTQRCGTGRNGRRRGPALLLRRIAVQPPADTDRRDPRKSFWPRRCSSDTIPPVTDAAAMLCEIGRRAYQRGLVNGGEGNISLRLDAAQAAGHRVPERSILCTPSGLCKGDLTPDHLCIVTPGGAPLAGARRPSSELRLHLEVYDSDAGVNAVVHTHPPYATTFALLGETLPAGFLPEAELFLGRVPLIPYETPGTAALAKLIRPHVPGGAAAILQNHGAVTWGADLRQAFMRTETLESCCRVLWQARAVGQPRPIPKEKLDELRRR